MQNKINSYVSAQFGASIEMLENAIDLCPLKVWNQKNDFSDFWYIAYHTIFWLDFYLTESPENFVPLLSFGMTELDPEGILPNKIFAKEELKIYVEHCRKKCKTTIESINQTTASKRYKFGSIELSFLELMLYNMRHVQHHTAQLNLLLRQQIDSAPRWVKRIND
jgi:hypothetical protein